MNAITRAALLSAMQHDKRLLTRPLDRILYETGARWWDEFMAEYYSLTFRAVRLYAIFNPICVGVDGFMEGYVECDRCASALSERMVDFVNWYTRQHPEYAFDEFSLEEAQAVEAEMKSAELAEKRRVTTYQISFLEV